jgi:RimJ/RimL family protein N-acetyltransferase
MIVAYEPEHGYEIINQQRRDCDSWIAGYQENEGWVDSLKGQGPAYTFLADGQVVGCAGITLLGWGRGEAWTLFSPLFYQNVRKVFKSIKEKLPDVQKEHGLRRIQAISRTDFEEGERFLKHLGFEKEGVLKSFGPGGEDVSIFGRINNG